jgi:orotidine-5'-phosphate decarboxylase
MNGLASRRLVALACAANSSPWKADSVSDAFSTRFDLVRAACGPLAWGLDPSGAILDEWGLGDTPEGLDRFVEIVLPVAAETVGVVKPQAAFFERHGWRGIRTLARLIEEARSAGLLVVLDAKRGDVGSSNLAYAEAYLGPDAPMKVDALTVHPYLGIAAMQPFVERAAESGSCLFVVTRSSNPEGRAVQASFDAAGRSVEQSLLDHIGELNHELAPGRVGLIGAVIGPTHLDSALDLVAPNALYLAPGVGRQGATPQDVAEVFASCPDRVMPSASRSLLASPDPSRLRDGASRLADEFRRLLVAGV